MNDPIDQLETELRQLRPAPLPATTQRRLDKITVRPPWHLVRWPVWGTALAAATATVIVTLLDKPTTSHDAPRTPLISQKPVKTDCPPSVLRVLTKEHDEGLVLVNRNTPYRKLRRQYVDLYTWDQCPPGTRLDYSVAAEELVLTPVAVY